MSTAAVTTAGAHPEVALGLGGLANLLNGYVGKFSGETVEEPFKKFDQVHNQHLEKCSLDAMLKALILVAHELPNHPETKKSPFVDYNYEIQEFTNTQKRIEDTLQWLLEKLVTSDALPPTLSALPAVVSDSSHFQKILANESVVEAQVSTDSVVQSNEEPEINIQTVLTDYALTLFPKEVRELPYFKWFEQMLRQGFEWEGTNCHWFDLYCHCLIGNLKQDKPEYCSRTHKILLEKGIAGLVLGQKEQGLKLDKLIAWATTQQEQYTELVRLLTEFAKPRNPQPKLRTLKLFDNAEDNNHYRKRWIDMVGRDDAMAEVAAFLTSEPSFSWWAVTGPSGMGKSRLALETCLRYGYSIDGQIPDWEAGFIVDDDALENTNGFDWGDWQPNRPYLIVVDYVVGREGLVEKMFRRLCLQADKLAHPVRILLLERDAGQQWWKDLTYEGIVKNALYKDPLSLTAPDSSNLWQIVQQVHRQHNRLLPEENRAAVLDIIHEVDQSGRPFFVILTALALAWGDYERKWARDELLRYHLEHDERLWQKGTNDANLLLKHKNLLALATMVGGLNADERKKILSKKSEFLPDFMGLTQGRDLYGRMAGISSENVYAPLEPDPYGEFYVLEWLAKGTYDLAIGIATEEFIQWAWTHKPDKISAFATRAFATYLGNEHLKMLYPLPPDDCDEDTASHRAGIVVDFTYLLQKNPALSFNFYQEIKTSKVVLNYPDSRLKLAQSAFNLILSLSQADSDRWREQAVKELDWFKQWPAKETDPALQLELAQSAKNLISNLSQADSDRWREQAVKELDWFKRWPAKETDPALQLELAQSAKNLISNLSQADSDRWREQAVKELDWFKRWPAKETDPALQLELAQSAFNLILSLSQADSDRWREQAVKELDWFKQWPAKETDPALQLELAQSAKNLISNLSQADSDRWREQAVKELDWFKQWPAKETDPALQLLLAQSAKNLISNLSQADSDRWREQAVKELDWFKQWPAKETDPALQLLLAQSAKNLILSLSQADSGHWRQKATEAYEWLRDEFVNPNTLTDVLTELTISTYFLLGVSTTADNWPLATEYFEKLDQKLYGVKWTSNLRFAYAYCIITMLNYPYWLLPMTNRSLSDEQVMHIERSFNSLAEELNLGFAQFGQEKQWQSLRQEIISSRRIPYLLRAYRPLSENKDQTDA